LGAPDRGDPEQGAVLARRGDFARALPACGACHGGEAGASGLGVPRLAGQGAAFLERRLDSFAAEDGPDRQGWNPMPAIAKALSPDERAAVATYLAGLPAGDPLVPARPPVQ
ncbi:c-type cytochrome, partial [Rhodovulum sulfidophilum]|nr:c-type cytochrome [Rhodovulum sulfidophilum]